MNPLIILGLGAAAMWALSQSGKSPASEFVTHVGANKYLVKRSATGTQIVVFDLQNRGLETLTYDLSGAITNVTVLGDFPADLVRKYHNQAVAEITQFPQKFGIASA